MATLNKLNVRINVNERDLINDHCSVYVGYEYLKKLMTKTNTFWYGYVIKNIFIFIY